MPSSDPSVINLSNSLTILRIVAIPFILLLMQADTPQSGIWATGAFIAAFITDWLDGFIARKKNQITRFGKMLDPLADKLLIGSALIMLISLDRVPVWMVILIISREIAVTWLRASLAGKGFILAADRWGKNKTFFQALSLIPLIIYYPQFGINLHRVGMALLWIAVLLTVWSGLHYFFRYYPMLTGGNAKNIE
jgi:CDP-diacylglycerol---glycerol-3-phosphate 3-phosphatidyltransferase